MSVLDRLIHSEKIAQLLQAAQNGAASAYEVSEGARAALAAAVALASGRQVIAVCPSEREGAAMAEDARQLGVNAAALPARERQFARSVASRDASWQRVSMLGALRRGETRLLFISADMLLWKTTPPQKWELMSTPLETDAEMDPKALINHLVSAGYERVEMVEGRGQCALRGAILDVFPPDSLNALRIEFFDNTIDSIRSFDCITQRSVEHMHSVCISPAAEYVLTPPEKAEAGARMHTLLESAQERFRGTADGLSALMADAETLQNGGTLAQMDLWAGVLMHQTAPLTAWPQQPIVLVFSPQHCLERLRDARSGFENELAQAIERMEAVPEQQDALLTEAEALQTVNSHTVITVQDLMRPAEGFRQGHFVQLPTLDAPSYRTNVRDLAEDLKTWSREKADVFLYTGGEARTGRLKEALQGVEWREDPAVRFDPVTLHRGFLLGFCGLYVISDADIYGTVHKKSTVKSSLSQRIGAFTDLKEGDFVVHEAHGVGIYQGVQRVQSEGAWRDYLVIQYRGTDRLYVPTDQFDRVQKYIGSQETPPPLNSLSGGEWEKQKSRVKAGLKKLAFNLVKLYAEREKTPGHAFSPDNTWTGQFSDAFPYELTDDQARAVEDIRRDMEAPRNMDRLLCGDVGYGKTEVAMRAAFKAVCDSKQVALLAPTTILAQQHYYTCVKRFKDFPVTIEVLSRFRSPKAQKEALMKAASGKADIIIGTHRLLSKDVTFKDLGLLIIDEQQRFGVQHKEQIKNYKKMVDVLTMSATPIPRTLHMSMVGVRDMSVLETPPEDRVPVQTYVIDYNESIIRDAILREMGRGGQVYFLYNRVSDIDRFAGRLRQLVPQARIVIGHGQMAERDLEDVMLDFYSGKYDVLLCSTIIENGLDVPNANTMIVYDADRFGLSQLYQLRGRVGRSNRVAYAYFTVRPGASISETAEKRLSAIREFTQFGAGFRIAMRDLEIRGAGDIFGAEQSGHIAVVGYDMYCRLIEEAVREEQGISTEREQLEPRIDLRINAFLPQSYIKSGNQRVEVYKRIAALRSEEERSDIVDELIDRYGDVPDSVMRLLDTALLRALCVYFGVQLVQRQNNNLFFRFDMRYIPDVAQMNLAMGPKCRLRFSPSRIPGLILPLTAKDTDEDGLALACRELGVIRTAMEKAKTKE